MKATSEKPATNGKNKTAKPQFSKYVLSNVFHHLPMVDALRIRAVSKKFDDACLIGFNISKHELRDQMQRLAFYVQTQWSEDD